MLRLIPGDIVDLGTVIDAELPADEPRVAFHAATRAHVPPDHQELFGASICQLGNRAPLTHADWVAPTA